LPQPYNPNLTGFFFMTFLYVQSLTF